MSQPQNKPFVIALEEHYVDPAVSAAAAKAAGKTDAGPPQIGMYAQLLPRLHDLGELRLREMDEAGIDVQVISHGPSALQQLPPAVVVPLATQTNNLLQKAILAHPKRFAGFAALPTPEIGRAHV